MENKNIQHWRYREDYRGQPKQIRHWEARGYITTADRVGCGERAYRHFTQKQVEQIQAIKKMMDEGYALAHASRLAKQSKVKGDA